MFHCSQHVAEERKKKEKRAVWIRQRAPAVLDFSRKKEKKKEGGGAARRWHRLPVARSRHAFKKNSPATRVSWLSGQDLSMSTGMAPNRKGEKEKRESRALSMLLLRCRSRQGGRGGKKEPPLATPSPSPREGEKRGESRTRLHSTLATEKEKEEERTEFTGYRRVEVSFGGITGGEGKEKKRSRRWCARTAVRPTACVSGSGRKERKGEVKGKKKGSAARINSAAKKVRA